MAFPYHLICHRPKLTIINHLSGPYEIALFGLELPVGPKIFYVGEVIDCFVIDDPHALFYVFEFKFSSYVVVPSPLQSLAIPT